MRLKLAVIALLSLFLFFQQASAQPAGTQPQAGDSCSGLEDGATMLTADMDGDRKDVILICDGTSWVAMGASGGGSSISVPPTCTGESAYLQWDGSDWLCLSDDTPSTIMGLSPCPSGDLSAPANSGCARLFGSDPTDIDDVMFYAGDVPSTTTDFFVRRCDVGQDFDPSDGRCEDGSGAPNTRSTLQWKNANTESDTTDIGNSTTWTNANATDGPANTTTLANDTSGIHPAAEACKALPGGGWYLPAISELDLIYANLNATDDPDHPLSIVNDSADDDNSGWRGPLRFSFDRSGRWYWSSTETYSSSTNALAWAQNFSNGDQVYGNKTGDRVVRCARR